MIDIIHKPEWLKIKIGTDKQQAQTHQIITKHNLHTICSSGRCPNQAECWGHGTATLMICGDICTRHCKFCNTHSGRPLPLDENEPLNIAKSIFLLKLKHVVITSVDRDDLPDLGANHWAKTMSKIKELNPKTTIEALIPDFQGRSQLIDTAINSAPNIISHNMETVERLTPSIRSVADYRTSLTVLKHISEQGIPTKSGMMVGLGETTKEVEQLMDDLLSINCRMLTIGQYLQPSLKHYPVKSYVTPEQFASYKSIAIKKGFTNVESGPLVRSSYHAENFLK